MKSPVTAWQQRHLRSLAIARKLTDVRAAADERPPGEQLATAATAAALAAGAVRNQVVRAAMTGAAMSSPDPDDLEHRTAAYGIARQAVYGNTDRSATAPVKEEP